MAERPHTLGAQEEPEVFCLRLERRLAVDQHLACSYCFGRVADVAEGDHDRFCGFLRERGDEAGGRGPRG